MTGQIRDIRDGFAEAFDAEIQSRGVTNDEMAHLLGTNERQVRRWRKGTNQPSLRTYRRIRHVLGWGQPNGDQDAA